MRITESKLRSIIRSVISESNIIKLSKGNVDLDRRGEEITLNQANKLEHDFIKKGKLGRKATEADGGLLYELLAGPQGNTNETIVYAGDKDDVTWAMKNEPQALFPVFVIDSDTLRDDARIVVFRTVGDKNFNNIQYYKLRLDGERFDSSYGGSYTDYSKKEIPDHLRSKMTDRERKENKIRDNWYEYTK